MPHESIGPGRREAQRHVVDPAELEPHLAYAEKIEVIGEKRQSARGLLPVGG